MIASSNKSASNLYLDEKEAQSKLLEEYSKKEQTPSEDQLEDDSKNQKQEDNKKRESKVIYEEDEIGREAGECVNDESITSEETLKRQNIE